MKRMDSGVRNWTSKSLPNLDGKLYVITGGNSGIGFEAAKQLGAAGGDVVLACRSMAKAEAASKKLTSYVEGNIDIVQLDLSDLSSVRSAAKEISKKYSKIDALMNNAGIMQTPELRTADGFEMQFGTNHLGHFLFSGLLLDRVEAAKGRIVTQSSIAHHFGKINIRDLMYEKGYSPMTAYGQSKLANLMFALELDRRLKAAGKDVMSVGCHPGYSNTNLQSTGPTGISNFVYKFTNPLFAQSQRKGALPAVLAAAGIEAQSGGYYGPRKMGETKGAIGDAKISHRASSEKMAKALWTASEELVDYEWDL